MFLTYSFKSSYFRLIRVEYKQAFMSSGASLLMFYSSFQDCSTPSETGYDFTGTSSTTYLGTSNAACATGYDGTASPAQVQCEASGNWTTVTGCTIKGKL